MKKGLIHNPRKWVVTVIVSTFFLFFWINGPLENVIAIQIESETNKELVKPVIIGKKKEKKKFGTIGDMETSGEGFSMILDDEDNSAGYKMIAFDEEMITGTAYGQDLLANAKKFYPADNAQFYLRQTTDFYYAEIQTRTEYLFYFQSKGISDNIKGYSGPINVGLYISEDGYLVDLVHVSSFETRSYMEKIAQTHYYDQFSDLRMNKSHEVDAISGATISSRAMALTTTDLVDKLYPFPLTDLVDQPGIQKFEAKASLNWRWIPHISIIFILFLYAFQKKLRKSKLFVLLTSLASVLFIGFYLNESFTYVTFIHPFIGTSLSSFMGIYALFVLLGAIWGKNTYCKYICPYGNVQRLQLKIWKGASQKFFLPNKWIKRIRFFIAIMLITGILAGMRNLSHLEPFPYFFGLEVQTLWFFLFAVAGLLLNWLYPMIWCRLLCPTGSVLDTLDAITTKKFKK